MAKKTPFAFKIMPEQAKGVPQRPAMPPGQLIDRSLGPDAVSYMAPPPAAPPERDPSLGGLAQPHDVLPERAWFAGAVPSLPTQAAPQAVAALAARGTRRPKRII